MTNQNYPDQPEFVAPPEEHGEVAGTAVPDDLYAAPLGGEGLEPEGPLDAGVGAASEVRDVAMDRGTDVVDTAKDEFARVAAEARVHARSLWNETSGQLNEQVNVGRRQLAALLHSLSGELGQMASKSDQDGPVTAVARQVSQVGGRWSHYLSETDTSQMLLGVRRYARRRPGVFLAGAAVAGLLVGRLGRGLMSGDEPDYERNRSLQQEEW